MLNAILIIESYSNTVSLNSIPQFIITIINVTNVNVAQWACHLLFLSWCVIKYSLLILMFPHGQQAVAQAGWVVAVVLLGGCSSAGWLIFHLSDLCVLGLGILDHIVEGILGLQVAVVEVQRVVWQGHPLSNGQPHCYGTDPESGGTEAQVVDWPQPPHSPSNDRD